MSLRNACTFARAAASSSGEGGDVVSTGVIASGTEALALIAGMAQALSVLPAYHLSGDTIPPGSGPHVRRQRDDLLEALLDIPGLSLLGPNVHQRSPNHIAVLVGSAESQPIPARAMVRELARRGVACSSGSACRSGQR